MAQATTIRTELENYMELKALNISQLGKISGLNPGTISSILSGNKVIAVDQLDRITTVMGLEHGHFYEQYIEECLINAPLNWRRIRPFLYRCAELGKLSCMEKAVALLIDNLTYSPLLFETAEDFFQDNKREAAAILYDVVASSERRQHSERLALCQYRLFSLRLGEDHSKNLQAAIQFEPFVERLDEIDQLDALKDLANTYRSLRRWDKVEEVAKEMGRKAEILYFMSQSSRRRRTADEKTTTRPLFTYIAYSQLLQASVCEFNKDYKKALEHTYEYADLEWVMETDSETEHWKSLFLEWAHANTIVNKMLSGDVSILPEYIAYIEAKQHEISSALINIVVVANRYNVDINHVLDKYKPEIKNWIADPQQTLGTYTEQVVSERLTRFLYEISYYYLNKDTFSYGFQYLLDGFNKSIVINNADYTFKFVQLFERYRDFATIDIQSRYQHILFSEGEKYEKKTNNWGCTD